MKGLGIRLRQRARELGLSDAEVARRVGLAATRYGNYAGDRHEPDLATFARICAVLGVSPAVLLGMNPAIAEPAASLRARLLASLEALDEEALRVLAIVADGLVARSSRPLEPGPSAQGRGAQEKGGPAQRGKQGARRRGSEASERRG